METRICNSCKIEKSLESFYRCKNCRQGRISICKVCKTQGKVVEKDKVHQFNLDFTIFAKDFAASLLPFIPV